MTCLYPGTFDPITNGHLDVVKRALKIFDKVVLAIATSELKKPYYSLEKREKLAKLATSDLDNVEIICFDSLLVDLAKKLNIKTIIRGLRAVSDFEYELQIGYANNALWSEIESVYLMPNLQNAFISSSIVRSILAYNGDVSSLVPKGILPFLKDKSCM
ncbi:MULTISPECIES: pantetheine-phosphate adenylyltransferase [unclassified Campylobacter]|uniref:pantetheine-phosphate adenylyltransferase n=1 Tax=unclassified Campylobacter TaxID=2593542 RepID=UPI001237F5BE|nr:MULTISPECIES: pantetheine-phosphate adenylyltransferase [unclassified Campylobacter]KAA6226348.1 pantetheine-phosphate adenylyltransferase [Campylobacter sp. LR286c]KAA6226614.1 pantetheine-phosphate adenylyltransferase [Campylobacter sp. LR185c]KAA6226840.1 pantetheine-phosphate adenylyltransferase [Campylobacter sp. LR196d]KAA6230277.1 pantetheine-phosphate adenylyltransferase [Campylobacter sp. LR291e]KAA6233798.1 pantetheine-phosphate adenylyltransferase [Campylobacter sp. LR264d]